MTPISSPSFSPSWLKETCLHFEDIARHHSRPLTIHLPTINDNGDVELLPPDKYDLSPLAKDVTLASQYQWKHIALESGVYYREEGQFPRALLWRIVSGGTLTIHSIDSIRSRAVPRNRPLTAIQFLCPVNIHPNCVGFAESATGTTLFIMTEDCVLHTILLSQNVLSGEERRTEVLSETINTHRPLFLQARFGQGRLSLDIPHFMHILDDSDRLIFAMKDGSLHQYNPHGTYS
jgi:hypothetical protein